MERHVPKQAMEEVLAIPELLDNILLHVDMVTLLVSASRVSKYWYSIISTSPPIQQALFFRPVSDALPPGLPVALCDDSQSNSRYEEDDGHPRVNPLLQKKFGENFFDLDGPYGYVFRSTAFAALPWAGGNAANTKPTTYGPDAFREVPPKRKPCPMQEAFRHRFTRSKASWRRMFVSQPPPPFLGYTWFEMDDGQTVSSALVETDMAGLATGQGVGLRMGQLYDMVQHRVGHHFRNSLWFRVTWNKPREPIPRGLCRRALERLLTRTNVIVEFVHFDDAASYLRDPADVDKFDKDFRCDEFRHIEVQTEDTHADMY